MTLLLAGAGPVYCSSESGSLPKEQIDKVLAIKPDVPRIKKAIYWDDKGLKRYDDPVLISWQGLLRLGDEYENKNPGVFERMIDGLKKDNVCYIAPTSGTTGEYSKGAIHTHETYINAFLALDKIAPLNENDRYEIQYMSHIRQHHRVEFLPHLFAVHRQRPPCRHGWYHKVI